MKNVLLTYLLLLVLSCQSQTKEAVKLTADEFEQAIQAKDIQILDVRTVGEFKSGFIKNALQADWTNKDLFKDRLQYVDKNKPVYIYCLVGGRSAAAANWLREKGYSKVIELQGGINAWKAANKPLEGNGNEKQLTMKEYLASIPKDKTVLVDFGADWCPPCVVMAPVINELQQSKEVSFLLMKVDAGVHTDIMKELNIEPIPLFIIYKKGKEVWRKEGIVSKEEFINQMK
ncbi:MAG: thioredoxin domain-containing protein [Chitinophagaceae bacterium]